MTKHKRHDSGFTLIEVMIVVVVLAILAAISYGTIAQGWKNKAYFTRSVSEMNALANATNLYVAKYNDYPAEVDRNLPSGLEEFVQGQEQANAWPNGPWPDSVYDYENWAPNENIPTQTYQISVRFCNEGDNATCKANAKKYLEAYVDNTTLENWDSYSSVYFCIKGSCRADQSKPIDHPGYCVNCGTDDNKIH